MTSRANQLEKYPDTLLTASSIVESVSDLSDVPGAPHVAPTGAEVQAAYDVAPRDIQLSTVAPGAHEPRVPHRPFRASTRVPSSCARSVTPSSRRAAFGRDAVRSRRRRRRAARQPQGEPGAADLPRDPLRLPVPTFRLRSAVRALLSLVPVLVAVGAASLLAWILSSSSVR